MARPTTSPAPSFPADSRNASILFWSAIKTLRPLSSSVSACSMKLLVQATAFAACLMGVTAVGVAASELDETTAPRAVLVRVNSAGQATVFRSDAYAVVTEDNFEKAIVETAVNSNTIARFNQVKLGAGQSELDFETSTSAWYWWSYSSYWSTGSWFSWNSYRYNWAYPCWYRGYYWYWYW